MQERVLAHYDSKDQNHQNAINFFFTWLAMSRDGDGKLVWVKDSKQKGDGGVKGSAVYQKSKTQDQEKILAACGALFGPELQAELLQALKYVE